MSGSVTEYPLPSGVKFPQAMVARAGSIWFLYEGGIGRIQPNGDVTTYPVAAVDTNSFNAVTQGTDGATWFTDRVHNTIGRISLP